MTFIFRETVLYNIVPSNLEEKKHVVDLLTELFSCMAIVCYVMYFVGMQV